MGPHRDPWGAFGCFFVENFETQERLMTTPQGPPQKNLVFRKAKVQLPPKTELETFIILRSLHVRLGIESCSKQNSDLRGF